MSRSGRRPGACLVVMTVLLAGCTAAPATPSPAAWIPGLDWATVEVARPTGFEVDPSATAQPPGGPGGAGHPGHFSGQAHVVDVAAGGEGLVAVGYAYPGWRATAWTSADGSTWRLATVDGAGDMTFMDSVASSDGRLVALGRRDRHPAAWWSDDGATWHRASVEPPDDEGTESCESTVIATSDGFVAGGCAGASTGIAEARFWWSMDGSTWERAAVDDADDGRVAAVTTAGPGLVAVGTGGSVAHPTGSLAWTSSDGRTWQRVATDGALSGSVLRSVTFDEERYVAVGETSGGTRATVVRSADGRAWERVADQPAFSYHDQPIRMTDVARVEAGLVAVGHHLFGQQYGNATAWVSSDGTSWQRAGASPVFPQGEMLAVTALGERIVAVGTYGAPDNAIPTIWVSPPP